MAREAVASRGVSIRLACEAFGLSQTGYRYERQRNAENEQIVDWLLRLTDNQSPLQQRMSAAQGCGLQPPPLQNRVPVHPLMPPPQMPPCRM
jgi:hypothetical protein